MSTRRGRPPKPKPATWQVGHFQAEFTGEEYILRHGAGLIMRTTDTEKFQEYCDTIKGA